MIIQNLFMVYLIMGYITKNREKWRPMLRSQYLISFLVDCCPSRLLNYFARMIVMCVFGFARGAIPIILAGRASEPQG